MSLCAQIIVFFIRFIVQGSVGRSNGCGLRSSFLRVSFQVNTPVKEMEIPFRTIPVFG